MWSCRRATRTTRTTAASGTGTACGPGSAGTPARSDRRGGHLVRGRGGLVLRACRHREEAGGEQDGRRAHRHDLSSPASNDAVVAEANRSRAIATAEKQWFGRAHARSGSSPHAARPLRRRRSRPARPSSHGSMSRSSARAESGRGAPPAPAREQLDPAGDTELAVHGEDELMRPAHGEPHSERDLLLGE